MQMYMPFRQRCQLNEHACLEFSTGNWSCLPISQAGDQYIDCIGGIDEQYNNSCTQNKQKHFQCYNSTKCISSKELCNGIGDCPFNDDETTTCPWLNSNSFKCDLKKSFLCEDNLCISRNKQCDKNSNCFNNEDEWFCSNNDNKPFVKNALNTSESRQGLTDFIRLNHAWFCNFGLPIYSTDENTIKKCLCPPNFYGERCQYQSNRIILIYRIDVPQYLENQMMKFVFYLYNINTTQIIDYDEIVHATVRTTLQSKKYYIYLVYRREGTHAVFLFNIIFGLENFFRK